MGLASPRDVQLAAASPLSRLSAAPLAGGGYAPIRPDVRLADIPFARFQRLPQSYQKAILMRELDELRRMGGVVAAPKERWEELLTVSPSLSQKQIGARRAMVRRAQIEQIMSMLNL